MFYLFIFCLYFSHKYSVFQRLLLVEPTHYSCSKSFISHVPKILLYNSVFTNVSILNNIAYINVYLLKSSEFFTKLEVVTFKVSSYWESVDKDDSMKIKEYRALKPPRPLLSHTRIIAVNL